MRFWSTVLAFWGVALVAGAIYRHSRETSESELTAEAHRLIDSQRRDEAEAVLRRLIGRRSTNWQARLTLAHLARLNGDWASTAAALRPVPDDRPEAAAVRVLEGDAWHKLDRARQAEEAWRRALKLDPTDTARYRLLYLFATQLRRREWLNILWELYDRDRAALPVMLQIMIADRVVWEPEEAIETVHRWVAADPEDRASRRALGIYLLRTGQVDEAADELERLFEEDSGDVETWSELVECRLATTDADRARELIARVPSGATNDPRSWKYRGRLALVDGRYADAVSDLRKGLPAAPYDLELHHNLAHALRIAGDLDDSARHSHTAGVLARIQRLCYSIYNAPSYSMPDIHELVPYCEELGLVEEGRGWVRLGLRTDARDPMLLAARERLAALPATSARHPPEAVIGDQSSVIGDR